MTQSDLLAQYAQRKDAEAFARIVTQYQRLVFATCRRKLRNPDDVDDAVQETFLRLARKASQLHTNLGGWLHACAVNVAIDMNRRRQSRLRYESAIASAAVTAENPQQILAELREHLDAAMQKLPARDRELIIERFFVGSAQADIAADAGVSPSTISYRLDRAIDLLRKHLKGMDCAAVTAGGTAALVSAMQAEHASAAVSQELSANLMKIGLSGVGSAAGIPVVLKLLLALAACVVLGAGAWIVVEQFPAPLPQSAQPGKTEAPPARPSAVLTVNPGQAGQDMPPNWQTTQTSAQRGVLAGRVLDTNGNGVAGATIRLSGRGVQTTKTDRNGNYSFGTLRGGAGDYTISVTARGFVPIEPYQVNEPNLQLSFDSHARRDFVLQRGVTVRVLVTDINKKPLPKVLLDVNELGRRSRGPMSNQGSDREGIATFTLPISHQTYVICAMLEGYAPARAKVYPTSANAPQQVNLVMQPGLKIDGVAICSDNKPAAGWSISATPDWWTSNFILPQVKIDKDGNFTLTSVGPGQYSLMLWRGHSGQTIGDFQFPPTTQPMRISVPSVSGLVTATGRVRFVHGRPPMVIVQAESLSGDHEFINAETEMGPSGSGRLRIPSGEMQYTFMAPPGPYLIRFESMSTAPASIDRIELPGDLPLVTLSVIGQPHLRGNVIDAATGAPITHFAIRVRKLQTLGDGPNYEQDAQWTQVSNLEGHFDIECVGPGIYTAQASVKGYAWLWSPPVRLEEDRMDRNVELRLTPGGSLHGKVLDPGGNPVAGAKVVPLSMARSVAMGRQDRFDGDAGAVVTDSAGAFLLPHLEAGDETIKVIDPDFAPLIVQKLKIVEGKTTDAGAMTLRVGGAVEGIVYDIAGKPAPGVTLQLQDADGYGGGDDEIAGRLASATTDDAGRYHVEHLPQQEIWINLQNRWQLNGVVRRVVRPLDGKTAHLDFGSPTPVKGRLLANGLPYADKNVELSSGSQYFGAVMVTALTDSQGDFTFFGPPSGRYTFFCQAQGRGPEWIAVRDIDITDQPMNLGDLVCDEGDVIVHIAADPETVSAVQYVSIQTDKPHRMWQDYISQAGPEGDHWRAKGVPAGHFRVTGSLKDSAQTTFSVPFDRRPNVQQTTVTLPISSPTATLNLINTDSSAAGSLDRVPVMVRNQDATVESILAIDHTSSAFAKLPPGIYQIMDRIPSQPRRDFDSIVLKDGESKQIKGDFSHPAPNAAVEVEISLWSSDGVLVTSSQPRLLDANGHSVESVGNTADQTAFFVQPGRYRVVVDRPGDQPFVKEVDVSPNANMGVHGFDQIDLVLP